MTSTISLESISYRDLYARWERGNWRSTEFDFSEDARQWREDFSDVERRAALWNYAMFLHGEDSVADNLSPFIDAAPRVEQKYFLATQQADEARHSVFFGRFMREVLGCGESYAGALEATRPELTWGFQRTFELLDEMAEQLRRDRSKPQLAAAITLYHLVIEANLAQPGQHFITRSLDRRGLLPGFQAGMANVTVDEQRHIAFGVKLLAELIAESEECRAASLELLREALPVAVAVFVPPDWDERYTECFGFTLEEIYTEGTRSLWTKLRTVGHSERDIASVTRSDPALPYEQRARRALMLLRADVLGERRGSPAPEPPVLEAFFEGMRFAVDETQCPPHRVTIQWDLVNAEPWFLRIDNGATCVERGRAASPDVIFRCRFEDLVDIATGREDPRRALLRRKLRPKGSLRALWQVQKLLPAPRITGSA